MIAVVPVRNGDLPAGGAEAVAEAGGRVIVVGANAAEASANLAGVAITVRAWPAPGFAPAAWASALAPLLADEAAVILPASPDGRDLAPRLAAELGRPLHAGAIEITTDHVDVARHGGRSIERVATDGPFVATLQPGARGVERDADADHPTIEQLDLAPPTALNDAEVLEVLPPDVTTMDLAEAPRIVAGGGGLDSPERVARLALIADALDASLGATRVVTDRGWVDHARQVGTTGVAVEPRLYVAFAIAGAVQHINGLGAPEHVIAVNTDPHCPMMAMAHLPIVADANAVIDELAIRLGASDG